MFEISNYFGKSKWIYFGSSLDLLNLAEILTI
jgi:hypothetical protein